MATLSDAPGRNISLAKGSSERESVSAGDRDTGNLDEAKVVLGAPAVWRSPCIAPRRIPKTAIGMVKGGPKFTIPKNGQRRVSEILGRAFSPPPTEPGCHEFVKPMGNIGPAKLPPYVGTVIPFLF